MTASDAIRARVGSLEGKIGRYYAVPAAGAAPSKKRESSAAIMKIAPKENSIPEALGKENSSTYDLYGRD